MFFFHSFPCCGGYHFTARPLLLFTSISLFCPFLHLSSSSDLLNSLFRQSSHLNCGLPHFLQVPCFSRWIVSTWYLSCGAWKLNGRAVRGSSAIECRAHNREIPGSNLLCYRFGDWAFSFSPRCPSSPTCINEYLAIENSGNTSDYYSCLIAAWLECFLEKSSWCRNEQVCQGGWSEKRFERSNRLDTAL